MRIDLAQVTSQNSAKQHMLLRDMFIGAVDLRAAIAIVSKYVQLKN